MGVALGAFNFYVLAQLAPWPVAQACTFFVMVYRAYQRHLHNQTNL